MRKRELTAAIFSKAPSHIPTNGRPTGPSTTCNENRRLSSCIPVVKALSPDCFHEGLNHLAVSYKIQGSLIFYLLTKDNSTKKRETIPGNKKPGCTTALTQIAAVLEDRQPLLSLSLHSFPSQTLKVFYTETFLTPTQTLVRLTEVRGRGKS